MGGDELKKLVDIDIDLQSGDDLGSSLADEQHIKSTLIASVNEFFLRYKKGIVGVFGLIMITLFIILILHIMKLGGTGGNPVARRNAIISLLLCATAIAILGSFSVWFILFYDVFA